MSRHLTSLNSQRLKNLKLIFEHSGNSYVTTYQIQKSTESCCPSTDIGELRANLRKKGKDIQCKYLYTYNGKKVFGYKLIPPTNIN